MNTFSQIFIQNLLPILIAASIGFLLHRFQKINPRPISQITFLVFTPLLVFSLLIDENLPASSIKSIMSFATALILAVAFVSFLVTRVARLSRILSVAFILAATFMNSGNFGLSLISFTYGEETLAYAGIFFATSSILLFTFGIFMANLGRLPPREAFLHIIKNPIIYAIAAAFLIRAFHIHLPNFIQQPIEVFAAAAIPVMLIVLGMQISKAGRIVKPGLVAALCFIRLFISPLLAWFFTNPATMNTLVMKAVIIEAAMPTAVFATIIAYEYDIEPDFVSGAVLATTLISPFSLSILIGLLG